MQRGKSTSVTKVNQDRIISNLNFFAKQNYRSGVNQDGICDALTLLYIFACFNNTKLDFLAETNLIGSSPCDTKIISRATNPPLYNIFEVYRQLIIFFQNKSAYLPNRSYHHRIEIILNLLNNRINQTIFLFASQPVIKHFYVINLGRFNFTAYELATALRTLITPNMMIKFTSISHQNYIHTVCLESDGTTYKLFDSNHSGFIKETTNMLKLCLMIQKANFKNVGLSDHSHMALNIMAITKGAENTPEWLKLYFIDKKLLLGREILANRFLLNQYNCISDDGRTQLFHAIDDGDTNFVELIINTHADTIGYQVNTSILIKDSILNSHRQFAINGFNALHYSIYTSRWAIAKLLIDSMMEDDNALNAMTSTGETPLSLVIQMGQPSLLNFLLMKGADPFNLSIEFFNNHVKGHPDIYNVLNVWSYSYLKNNREFILTNQFEPTGSDIEIAGSDSEYRWFENTVPKNIAFYLFPLTRGAAKPIDSNEGYFTTAKELANQKIWLENLEAQMQEESKQSFYDRHCTFMWHRSQNSITTYKHQPTNQPSLHL